MATLSGSFTGPAVTGPVSYAAGAPLRFSITGEWPKAIINTEVSHDAGATWETVWCDYGIEGAFRAAYPHAPGSQTVYPPGAGLFRLRCVEFRSGWCNWSIST